MSVDDKISSLLGMAQKAGKIVSGEFAIDKTIRAGKAKLLLVTTDSSDNTKKRYYDSAAFYNVRLIEMFTKSELSKFIGKANRAALVIIDDGFSKAILNLISPK